MKYREYEVIMIIKDSSSKKPYKDKFNYMAKAYKSRKRILQDLTTGVEVFKDNNPQYKDLKVGIELGKFIRKWGY